MTAPPDFLQKCYEGDIDSIDEYDINTHQYTEGVMIALNENKLNVLEKLLPKIKLDDNKLLIKAIESGNIEAIKILTTHKTNLFYPNDFINPLIIAIEEDSFIIFEHLLNFLAENENAVLFNVTVQLNYFEYVAYLLSRGDFSPLDMYQGNTPLTYAIRKGHYKTLQVLLKDQRVSVSYANLKLAASRSSSEVMKLLLSYYPDDINVDLFDISSLGDHADVMRVISQDLRINPWDIKSTSNLALQIIDESKGLYSSKNEYLDEYKIYERYFIVKDTIENFNKSLQELKLSNISSENLGYDFIIKSLGEYYFEIGSLKKNLELMC